MDVSVQNIWDKFDHWSDRYLKIGDVSIRRMLRRGYSTPINRISYASTDEFLRDMDVIDDLLYCSKRMILQRLEDRVSFFSRYLAHISFDGPEFMQKKSEFIWKQNTSDFESLYSIWLVQDDTDRESTNHAESPEPTTAEISFQCTDIKDVDLASMYSVFPYNRMLVWQPNLSRWDDESMSSFIKSAYDDLAFDYDIEANAIQSGSSGAGYGHLELGCTLTL